MAEQPEERRRPFERRRAFREQPDRWDPQLLLPLLLRGLLRRALLLLLATAARASGPRARGHRRRLLRRAPVTLARLLRDADLEERALPRPQHDHAWACVLAAVLAFRALPTLRQDRFGIRAIGVERGAWRQRTTDARFSCSAVATCSANSGKSTRDCSPFGSMRTHFSIQCVRSPNGSS